MLSSLKLPLLNVGLPAVSKAGALVSCLDNIHHGFGSHVSNTGMTGVLATRACVGSGQQVSSANLPENHFSRELYVLYTRHTQAH